MARKYNGALYLIGGAADKTMSDFVRLTGGADKHFVILTHASAIPRQRGNQVTAQLKALGVKRITVITPRTKNQTIPLDADAVFMSGGDQLRLVRLLTNSGLLIQLLQAQRRGVIIAAGTSAGAAAVAYIMIAGGMRDGVLDLNKLVLAKGLCLLPGVVVDTHFGNRGRENRLRAALAWLEDVCGIGLDEDTAVYITSDGVCTVYGEGEVWLFEHDREVQLDGSATLEDVARSVKLNKFGAGQRFTLPR
jgi:cyanophycinase